MTAAEDKYRLMLQKLLPRGSAWNREPGTELTSLLQGLAAEPARVEARALVLVEEADPRTTTELITDWERVCGLPGPCEQPTALADRRNAIVQKLLGSGDPNLAFWQEQAEALGFIFQSIEEYKLFAAGSCAGDHVIGLSWILGWVLVVAGQTDELNDLLACTISNLAPIHTRPKVNYTPYAYWRHETYGGAAATWYAATHNDAAFIIAGTGGQIRSSPIGTSSMWSVQGAAGGYVGTFYGGCNYGTYKVLLVGGAAEIQYVEGGSGFIHVAPAGGYAGDFRATAKHGASYVLLVGSLGEIQVMAIATHAMTQRTAGGSYAGTFFAAASDGTIAVIAGESGEIQYSASPYPNDQWIEAAADGGFTGTWSGATYANGFFWLVGYAAGGHPEVQQSRDGITWRRVPVATADVALTAVVGDGVGGIMMLSTDYNLIWHRKQVGPEMVVVSSSSTGTGPTAIVVQNGYAVHAGVDGDIGRAKKTGAW